MGFLCKDFSFGIRSIGEERDHAQIFYSYGKNDYHYLKIPSWIIPPFYLKEWNTYGKKYNTRICPREYSVSKFADSFLIYYGVQDRSGLGQSQCLHFDIAWERLDLCRWSIYQPDGSLLGHVYNDRSCFRKRARWSFDKSEEYRDEVKKVKIEFKDFDGEDNIATCFIEERVWSHGVSFCRWLQFFKKDFVRRQIDIKFEKETGNRKGSWKGGTIGCGQDIQEGQSILSGFLQYAKEHNFSDVRLYTGDYYNND